MGRRGLLEADVRAALAALQPLVVFGPARQLKCRVAIQPQSAPSTAGSSAIVAILR